MFDFIEHSELSITTFGGKQESGILSLVVYLASIFILGCTFMGVSIMDISTMFEWCGRALRVQFSNIAGR